MRKVIAATLAALTLAGAGLAADTHVHERGSKAPTISDVSFGNPRVAKTFSSSQPLFMDRISIVGGPHPTSGLPGFPARDYLGPGEQIVRAPFNGCVPTVNLRPWGWARVQNPAAGFGGMRIYLTNTTNSRQAYGAHFGFLFLRPGQCFKQGDPVGKVWWWPNDAGRSHIHLGYQGGDPLFTLIDRNGRFLIKYVEPKPEKKFLKPRLVLEDTSWIVRVGNKVVYKGGREKANQVYKRQKVARLINLHFRREFKDSPLVGFGLDFAQIAGRYDVDPRLEAAIASCETSGGTKGDGPKVRNDFGLLLPGSSFRHREFDTRRDAILYLSKLLRTKYIDTGRATIEEIGARYAPVGASNDPNNKNSRWVTCVTKYYKELNGTRYLSK